MYFIFAVCDGKPQQSDGEPEYDRWGDEGADIPFGTHYLSPQLPGPAAQWPLLPGHW